MVMSREFILQLAHTREVSIMAEEPAPQGDRLALQQTTERFA